MARMKHPSWYPRAVGLLAVLLVLAPLVLALSIGAQSHGVGAAGASDPPVVVLASIRKYGSALADEGKVGAWSCGTNWVVGSRWGDMTADNDSLGGGLPPGGYVATLSSFVQQRFYRLTLYAPQDPARGRAGGDLIIEFPYDAIGVEAGTVFPTGRYDPLGKPSLFFAENLLRANQAGYTGSGSVGPGFRLYLQCSITPPNPGSGRRPAIDAGRSALATLARI